MCGIAGILNLTPGRPPREPELAAMITQLRHRGPDGYGFYHDDQAGFAHARLSIIDLAGGKQPIHNEDQTVWVTFNGEIFNYLELRAELEQQGHRFYTHSDTEVLVHLYEQHGDDFVQRLNGQFAFAIWDLSRRRMILVRDRVGILPLFYTVRDGRLIFASEIKAILAADGVPARPNFRALDQIMTFWAPVSPETMFEGIEEVGPGQMIVVESGKLRRVQYWDWRFPETGDYHRTSVDEQAAQLHDLLVDATQLRLRADVPVGAYLSGGLDSSVLVALIHHHTDAPLRTFSIGFDDTDLDETRYQQQMIDHLGTHHSRIQIGNRDIADHFVDTIRRTEAPILRNAPVPMRLLSGLVRSQGYKVVLTGEGSDEVLGGYDIFKEAKIRRFWAQNPDSKFRPLLLKRLYPYLDISQSQGLAYLQSFFGNGIDQPDVPYFAHLPRWTTTARCKDFFSDDLRQQLRADAMETIAATWPSAIGRWHPFNRGQYIEAKSLMAGYLLCSQGDRMLMANSVEGRFPFLDHRVIEFANRVHPKYKMRALNEKYLLKRAMSRYLPADIIRRHKQPYRAPDIPAFFGDRVPEFVRDMLAPATVKDYGYFHPDKVARLVQKIEKGRAIGYKDNMALVGILSTQAWHHLFIKPRVQAGESTIISEQARG